MPVARIRKPKEKRVSFVQEEERGGDDEEEAEEDKGADPAAKRARRGPAK